MIRRDARKGIATIELALICSLIVAMVLGVVDFGLVIHESIVLNDAAYVAAQFGAVPGNATNSASMKAIATQAAAGVSGFSVTPTNWCTCSLGGAQVSCSSTCVSYGGATYGMPYGSPISYVQVTATATAYLLFQYTGLPLKVPLSATCVMRTQ